MAMIEDETCKEDQYVSRLEYNGLDLLTILCGKMKNDVGQSYGSLTIS